jgi:glucose-1-phosphate cytidylyltransferase
VKTVVLCGGMGTRLSEQTQIKPKPMVEVGGMPILRHIMKLYSYFGHDDFVLALGYKAEVIKDYFLHYHPHTSDVTVHLSTGEAEYSRVLAEDWHVRMVDTGQDTMTGGRLRRLADDLRSHGTFMLTYGDGVANVDISELLSFHKRSGKLATITAVRPPARFGTMSFDGDLVTEFREKPQTGEGWINGGFFVMEPGVLDYLSDDTTVLEEAPLERLAKDGELVAFKHSGFWQCMDTLRDRDALDRVWNQGNAPWKLWEEA